MAWNLNLPNYFKIKLAIPSLEKLMSSKLSSEKNVEWRMSNNALDLKTEIMIGYIAVYYAAIVTNKSSVNLPRILFKQVLKFGHAGMK